MEDALTDAYGELAGLLVGEESVQTTLNRVADLAVRLVPGCDVGAVTVRQDGGFTTETSTDALAVAIDEEQYRTGEGPCLDAIRQSRTFRVDRCSAEERWPRFCAHAREHGIESFLAVPISVRGETIGALNLYSRDPDGFTNVDADVMRLFSGAAGKALANAQVYRSALRLVDQLQDALDSRAVIEQAKGILMVRERISADAAFALLAATSQRSNRKLREVAQQVVDSAVAPG